MKKKSTYYYLGFVFLFFLYANSSQHPNSGRTGAPGDSNCNSCHAAAGAFTGNVAITGLPATIESGETYPLTVTTTVTNGSPSRSGFQMVALNSSNTNAGTFANNSVNTSFRTINSRQYFGHQPAQSFGGNSSVSWTVDWTAPAATNGEVITMYTNSIIGNGSGNGGDDMVHGEVTATIDNGAGGTVAAAITNTTDVTCFGGNDGSATAEGSMGSGNYGYSWSSGDMTATANNLMAGTYTVTVTDMSNGATATAMATINQPNSAVNVSIVAQQDIDCNNMTGSATASGSGGTGDLIYSWSNGMSGQTVTLNSGPFTVTATDADGCFDTASGTITQVIDPPITEAGPNMQIDCNTTQVTLQGSGSNGSQFSYSWSTTNGNIVNGANTQTPIVDAAGVYDLVITNNDTGCTGTDNTTVTEDTTPPNADAGADMELSCLATEVTLDGTGSTQGMIYSWSTTDGNIVNGGNSQTPTVDAAGTYTLVVTNPNNGCVSAPSSVIVTQDANVPVADAGDIKTLTCAETEVTLDGSGSSQGANFSYQWTTTNGNIVAGANGLMPTVDAVGQYCIEVTDNNNGCVAMGCVSVNGDFAEPVVSIAPPANIDCANSCVTLDGSASSQGAEFLYQWAGPNIVNGENSPMAEVCQAGVYELFITNLNNGCTASAMVEVVENTDIPSVAITIPGNLNCNNSSITITATSDANNPSYSWTGPNGFTSNVANPSVSVAGTYEVTVIDNDNGCMSSISEVVEETIPPTATISNQTNVNCNGQNTGSATVMATDGTGNYTYLWSSGGMMATETGLAAGMYTVTVTDGDQCTATASVTITEPTAITVNASATDVSAVGADDGTATANPMGGTPAYMYLWSNMETTQTITGLAPGTYTVTVTDANGCSAEESVIVSSVDCAGLTLDFDKTDVDCNGANTGSATALVNGATMPITYVWSNGGMDAMIDNLSAGTYSVTATDANNCEIIGSTTITEPTDIAVMPTGTNPLCNGGMDGTASVTASGGTGMLTYMWSNGMSGAMITNIGAGTYSVTATDENGCMAVGMVILNEPDAIVLTVMTTNESANGANDGSASVDVSGGTMPINAYLWSNGATTQLIENLAPGEYCVTVTDNNGCTAESCGTVAPFGCGDVTTVVTSTPASCFGEMNGTATAESFGGTEPYVYSWSNGGSTPSILNLTAGTYTVTCTDASACSAVMSVVVEQPDELTISIIDSGDVDCEGNNNGFATAEASGGVLGYTYLWSNGTDTNTATDLAPGTYTVTVTDPNMCTAETSVMIGLSPDTEAPMAVTNNIEVSLDANGLASITAEMIDGGSTDNCGIQEISIDIMDFNCSNLGENTVTLTVTDDAGLTATETAIVTVIDEIAPMINCPADIVEQGCNVIVEYDMATASDNCSVSDIALINGLPSGSTFPSGTTTIEYMATDASGNSTACSFTVTLEADFSATASSTATTCAGFSDGTATVVLSGGVEPFIINWDDPTMQSGLTATDLSAGVYTATATDATGCTTVVTVEVTQPDFITIDIIEIINETNENMDGSITIEVNGGTGNPFSYEWFLNGELFSTAANLENLAAGTYMVSVIDGSGCTNTETIIVDNIVGTFENNATEQIDLYPNPTTGEFQLDIQLATEKEISVSIFDLTGKAVYQQASRPVLKENLLVDLNEFSDGVYLVRVQVGEDVLMRRVILSKK